MIDLTPLDVRKKRGDFGRAFRGYTREEVDGYLELVAERLEELVRDNLTLRERGERLAEQVAAFQERERAVQDAIVTAEKLRDEIRTHALREAELLRREAEAELESARAATERLVAERRAVLADLGHRRMRFLHQWRAFLEREMDELELEEARMRLAGETALEDIGRRPATARGGEVSVPPDGAAPPELAPAGTLPASDSPEMAAARMASGTAEEEARRKEAAETAAAAQIVPRSGPEERASDAAAQGEDATEAGEPLWLSSILDEEEQQR